MTLHNHTYIKKNIANFSFSAKLEEKFLDKIADVEIEDLLNKNLHLSNYSQDVKNIGFIFIVIAPENNIHPDKAKFYPKSSRLFLELALDYSRFAAASPEEAKLMMAELYLEAIKTYPKIRGMKKVAFNYEQFYTDVRNLFEKEGWLGAL